MNTLITKEFDIEQPIGVVWKSLADPEDIVTCVPGAAITEKVDEKNYKGEVVTKFGPIKAKYAGDIEIVELDEANHKMVLKGRGLDSKGKGSADMIMNGTLEEADGKTNVKFSMDITIVGMLAQFGSRLINDVSDQLLNQFVGNFKNKLAAATPEESVAETTSAATTTGGDAAAAETKTEASESGANALSANGVVPEVKPSEKSKPAPKVEPIDNSLDATSLFGTVIKSIFGGIWDAIKGIFGGKKG